MPPLEKRYVVSLTAGERDRLSALIASGKGAARKLTHARVLLKADSAEGGPHWSDPKISEALEVGLSTIARIRRRFVEEGMDAALDPCPPRREYRRKVDGEQEAHLIALSCSTPPAGRARWTLRLLAEKMVQLEYIDGVSHEAVRQVLKKTSSSPG